MARTRSLSAGSGNDAYSLRLSEVLRSAQDSSVNFVFRVKGGGGFLEARYVRRRPGQFIIYLSSESGCEKACRMCHLTATGQNRGVVDAGLREFLAQAEEVLRWHVSSGPGEIVHFNFMARGEPLASSYILENADELLENLGEAARRRGLRPRFLISTIMPEEMDDKEFVDVFKKFHPEIYYSIYSMNENFRKRWLPRALPATFALGKLSHWQRFTRKIPKLHWAFIEGENDSLEDVTQICEEVKKRELLVDINIVRYNPFDARLGRESEEGAIWRNVALIREQLPYAKVKVIPRVGFDVKASCGMFVNP